MVHDGEDELAPAIVLRQPFAAVAIGTVGQVPVRRLKAGVPADEVAALGWQTHPRQGRPHQGAVANPGARVTARPRMQRRTVAIDEDVCRGRLEGVHHPRRLGRQADVECPQLVFPLTHRDPNCSAPDSAGIRAGRLVRVHGAKGDGEIDLLGGMRRQLQVEAQRAGGIAEGILHPILRRQVTRLQVLRDRALGKGRGAELAGGGHGDDPLAAIDPDGPGLVDQLADLADAAEAHASAARSA